MNPTLPAPLDVRLMNWTASALFVGCAVLVLAAGARWALRNPVFALHRIVVQGDLAHNNAVTLRANVAPSLAGNFFTVDLSAARAAFEQVPWVRRAQVRREFPGSLRVVLQEHQAAAFWGSDTDSAMVNTRGEVFEANAGDVEQDNLPRLEGPAGHSAEMLAMLHRLQPVFEPLGMGVDVLELSGRGGWRATLDSDAVVELGGGTPDEVVQRTQRFVRTLTQVAAQYQRRADALESADLRHAVGYAVRLRGVTTVAPEARTTTDRPTEGRH
jgi:cell division protein FtsQ